jgi:hypothetical protein
VPLTGENLRAPKEISGTVILVPTVSLNSLLTL